MKKIVILVGMAVVLSYTPLTTKIVNAKVNGYVIKDKSNQYSYYNAKQLEDSFLNYKLKSQEGKELYLDFINKKENSIEYVHDDSGKYVKYKDMEDEYNKVSNKNDFNLGEQVKAGIKAIDLPQEMKKLSVDAGKITNDILYPKDGQTYDGNKGTINKNLYVEDNNIKVSNTTIKGTLFINPGPEGVVNIENLQADKVVLLSGSVHFINVVSERLEITSESQVRVTSQGNSNIDKTIVSSSTILENSSGTFGTVEVKQTDTSKRIEFRGKFESPVEVNGKADIVAASNSLINQIKVAPKFSADAVNIQGQGIRLVEVLAKADITFGEGTKTNVIIQDSNTEIEVKANAEIVVDDKTNSASISGEGTNKKENLDSLKKTVEADIKKSEEAGNIPPVVVEPGNGGSGSSVDYSIAVSAISITGAGNLTTVVNGETLQMSAAVTPTNATNKAVTWSVINITGTATIDANGLITATGVGTVTVKATNAASGVVGQLVVTVEPTLAAVKEAAKGELAAALLTYTEGNYSAGNWTALTTAKTDGDTAIDAAIDLAGVASAKTTALNAMAAVKTISQTAAEAEVAAVEAINNADEAGMGAAITANAAVLGLDLTDYNRLSDNSSVITAMVALHGADKATIVSTFNTAVANEKAAEALAAAKAAAKGELAAVLLTYTEGNYSAGNWTALTTAKTDGDTAIDAATDLAGVASAKATALNAMDAVKTISETTAEAEVAAVAAINNADAAGMGAAITTNAAVLGLDLTDYNELSDKSSVITAMVELDGANKTAIVSTFNTALANEKAAEALAAGKVTAKGDLTTALGTYTQSDYTADNWTTLTTAKTDGDTAIDAATDLAGVASAKTTALNAMDAVKTIAETAAEAEAAAVAAINNADAAGMGAAITANAAVLGLDLTDYNELSDKSSVITAMVALHGANKTTIVSTFNTAVTNEKAAEALAAAKVAAKGDLTTALGIYTQSDYTVDNWTALTKAKTDGDAAIDAATDLAGVGSAKTTALNAMAAVKTISQTAAEAEAAAVAAINNADAAGMGAAITANAATLGLDLTDYNGLSDKSSVITAMVVLHGANKATIVSTFNTAVANEKAAEALAAGKVAAKGDLTTALGTYTQSDYTVDNWTALTKAKTDGDTAIDAAIDLAGVASAKTTALNAMDAVKTIAETTAEAEAAAVAAINNADEAGMGAAITTNAATLGLDLTDYNGLSDKSSVITAMVVLHGANKATIVSTFNTAVALAAAKAAIEGATYTNLEVTDTNNQAEKTAAVQGVVNGVKGTTTATVSWNAGTSKYDVAISLNEANTTTSISTAIFVSSDEYYEYEFNGTNVTINKYLNSNKIVKIPEQIEGMTVTEISPGAFRDNSITSVTIPNSITSIGTSAFNGNSLTSLIIPSNVSIDSYAFIGNSLTSITIGSNVSIGDHFLEHGNSSFRDAYASGGAGTYTGTQSGTWTKVAAPSTPTSTPTITGTVRAGNFVIVSGTAETGANVVLSINGTPQTPVTAMGGYWAVSGLTLSQGDTISVTAILAPKTISAAATATVVAPANFATFTAASLDDVNYINPCLILNNLSNIEPGSTFDIKKLTYSDGFKSYALGGTYESFGDPAGSNQGNYYYNSVDKKLIIVLTDDDINGLGLLPCLDLYNENIQDTLSADLGWNVFNGVKAQHVPNVLVTTVK